MRAHKTSANTAQVAGNNGNSQKRAKPGIQDAICTILYPPQGRAACVRVLASRAVWLDAHDGADDTPLHLAAR